MSSTTPSSTKTKPTLRPWWIKWPVRCLIALLALFLMGVILTAVGVAMIYPKLPDVSELADYRPKLPLRITTAEGDLIGEFGDERRDFTKYDQIPKIMIQAVLAIEDARFFEHGGLDFKGLARAGLANLQNIRSQGASTISMQVARNVYLTSERTITRKLYEILLTYKLENALSKEQILEIYMNQIFLGQRAYGFAMAARTYFGKDLKDISIAEAAMLAGLPKAPSKYNPIVNPQRASKRQQYIIDRMLENGFITEAQAKVAKIEELVYKRRDDDEKVHAEYVAEMVRQVILQQYTDTAYSRGLTVTTTIRSGDQIAAHKAVRKGILDYDRRQAYRGPEKIIELPSDPTQLDDVVIEALTEHPDSGELLSAVVIEANVKKVVVKRQDIEPIVITGDGLKSVISGLTTKPNDRKAIVPGAVVRMMKTSKGWHLTQLPEVEAAFVSMESATGALRSLVGGFDFFKSHFNHVSQAWRQPGSSFKPFVYSAALEKGLSPATVVNDAPLTFGSGDGGAAGWEPKNYDGTFDGPMTVRRALARSKNMVSIRVLQLAGATFTQDWVTHFGFQAEKHPPYLTMALGAGSVTPLQMVQAYGVFANRGLMMPAYLIQRITDPSGKVLFEATPPPLDENLRVIPEGNAYVMNSLLQEITRSGTAARAQGELKRPDLFGKTGTTNDAMDAWFVGFQPSLVAATWMGYDTPRNMGNRETGGGLSLPIWIQYMAHALKKVPVTNLGSLPEGVVNAGGDLHYQSPNTEHKMVRSLGMRDPIPRKPREAPSENGAAPDTPSPSPAASAPTEAAKPPAP